VKKDVLRSMGKQSVEHVESVSVREKNKQAVSPLSTRAAVAMWIPMGMGMGWVWGRSSTPTDPWGFYGDF